MSQVSLRRLNSKAASNRAVGGSRAVAAKSAIATKSAGIARNKVAVAKSKVAANNVAAASKAATGKADAKLNLIIAMKERREATPAVYLLIPPSNKRERMVNLIFIPHLGPLLFVRGKSSVDWIVGTARIP